MEEVLASAVGLQGRQALDAGRDVGHEGGHRHVVQALQLPDEDLGDSVENGKNQDQRTDGHQEPRENAADDPQAEEHQDHVLDEHFHLEGQTGVDWKETETKTQRQVKTGGPRTWSGPVGLPSSMSLEKRLRMRPVGVVSKNFMGQRRILWKSWSCSLVEALRVP